MDTKTTKYGYNWAAYKAIEEDMLRVAEYIPLETRQYEVYSFKLADIIMRSCSYIESLFKDVIRNQDLSDHPDQEMIKDKKRKRRLTIKDLIEIFCDYWSLAPIEVSIRRNNDQLKPFKEFKNPDLDDKIPTWWQAYNKLKHDFYKEVEKGTLENALLSLSALFVLNCKLPLHFNLEENINYLVTNGIITSPNFIHAGHLLDYVKTCSTWGEYNLLAETNLFQYWLSYNEETIGAIIGERVHVTDELMIPAEK